KLASEAHIESEDSGSSNTVGGIAVLAVGRPRESSGIQPLIAIFVDHIRIGDCLERASVVGCSSECDISASRYSHRRPRLEFENSRKLPPAAQTTEHRVSKPRALHDGGKIEDVPAVFD